ncbi:MAG TPA: amidohydrolase [Acidimicrobiales bacterium]|nr:amidohydrolase [Acidimicrobiales bacterium]
MLLISDVTAITMDEGRRVIGEAAIAIDGERIVAVDKVAALATRYQAAEVIDGRGMVAIPGLIDTHAHADQSILRGTTDDLHWIPFLRDWIDPYLQRRDPADTVAAYRLSALEMVRSGTTCFLSPNFDPNDDLDTLSEALGEIGLRAVLGRWVEPEAPLAEAVDVVSRWDGACGGRIRMWFGLMVPRQPGDGYFPEFYRAVASHARDLGTGITYHFCSEIEDAEYYEQTFGLRPAQWALDHGVLGPNVVLINGCWMSRLEVELLAGTGTSLAYSPSATMKMATGITPMPELLAAGVNVSLGTDGGANNNSHDMIREMKAACLLQNVAQRQAGLLTAEDALELATIGGARALGMQDELGSIEAGKRADIVLVDLGRPHTSPVTDPVSNLVYAAHGGDVDTVIIDGRVVMLGGTLSGIDEAAILADAQLASERVRGRITPQRAPKWPRL